MSYLSTNAINSVAATNSSLSNQQSVANMLNNLQGGNITLGSTMYDSGVSLPRSAKPSFKLEFYLAENGGFVMGLMGWNTASYTETCKLFIIKDLENMGRDIQNILATEVLKQ
jgi:hypothetical protein